MKIRIRKQCHTPFATAFQDASADGRLWPDVEELRVRVPVEPVARMEQKNTPDSVIWRRWRLARPERRERA
jgi:hypothetical protein